MRKTAASTDRARSIAKPQMRLNLLATTKGTACTPGWGATLPSGRRVPHSGQKVSWEPRKTWPHLGFGHFTCTTATFIEFFLLLVREGDSISPAIFRSILHLKAQPPETENPLGVAG